MSDYISRQANEKTYKLYNGQEVTFHYNDDGIGLATIEFMDAIFERLNNSVEVVRCKDCKHLDKGKNDSESWCECTRIFGTYFDVSEDDFCSYGDRADT